MNAMIRDITRIPFPQSESLFPQMGWMAGPYRASPQSYRLSDPTTNGNGLEAASGLDAEPTKFERFVTVRRLAELYRSSTSESALRNLIWHAEAYAKHPKSGLTSNHFLPVIVRPPNQRKVLLDRIEYVKWVTRNQAT